MKIFNSINYLWDYCKFCPICQESCREIKVQVGPDPNFTLISYKKDRDTLQLWCSYKNRTEKYTVEYSIFCKNNSFKVNISNPEWLPSEEMGTNKKAKTPYFYFYLLSNCPKCNSTDTYTSDLELNLIDNHITNIKIERDNIYFTEGFDGISYLYDSDKMLVFKRRFADDNQAISLPMVEFDFSNQTKVIDRLKTLILFS